MRYFIRIVSAALGAVALVVASAAPAEAALRDIGSSDIELSVDGGVTWYSDGAPALFAELGSLRPGGAQTGSVRVRNTSTRDAVLRIAEVIAMSADPSFVSDLTFQARTPDVTAPVVADVERGVCTSLLDGHKLKAGESTEIELTVTMAPASGNPSQGGAAPLEFVVSLVEFTGGANPPVSCSGGSSAGGDRPTVMANTGSDWRSEASSAGLLAFALLGGGLVALAAGRRRRPDEP